jgi:hypothetical protein
MKPFALVYPIRTTIDGKVQTVEMPVHKLADGRLFITDEDTLRYHAKHHLEQSNCWQPAELPLCGYVDVSEVQTVQICKNCNFVQSG